MMYINALLSTIFLSVAVCVVSITIGALTAILAWSSNKVWAYYAPVFVLSVPPWLLAYNLSDAGLSSPWIGTILSLGICCSVYPHILMSSSLSNRAYKSWEMLCVVNGKNLKSLFLAVQPSLKLSILPSFAIVAAEVIADFGVCNFYGVDTLNKVAYSVWTSTWDLSQLRVGIVMLAFLGVTLSRCSMAVSSPINPDRTSRSSLIIGLLSVLPVVAIVAFSTATSAYWMYMSGLDQEGLLVEFKDTMLLTLYVVILCAVSVFVYVFGYARTVLERVGLLMYSMPGTALGAGILYMFSSVLSMFALLIIAIAIRYFGLILHSVAVSYRSSVKTFEIVDLYTEGRLKTAITKLRILLPSVSIGMCMIILDVIRELPISVILQPMNFQTLAMRMNYIARNETLSLLGFRSILLLMLGLGLCFILVKSLYATDKKSQL